MNITSPPSWYIVRSDDGYCHILSAEDLPPVAALVRWGPYATLPEAMAQRVGLIQGRQCRPN